MPAGTNFSYTLDVANGGPSGAHNVKVVDTLPAGVTFVSASGGATWSCAYSIITNKVTCDLTGTLASGASAATITVTVKAPNEPEVLSNSATVSSTTSDPVAANNTDTEATTVNASADLSIDKKDSADPVAAGTNFSYTLDVANGGPSGAHNVKVVDTLPAGVTFVSASGGATWSCAYSIITNKVTCDLTGTARLRRLGRHDHRHGEGPERARGPVQLGHRVLHDERPGAPPTTPTPRPPRSTPRPTCRSTRRTAADPVAAGKNFSYTLDVANGGPSGAHNVKVVDTLPAGVTFVSASGGATWSCAYSIITNKVTCDLTGTLASGASAATITVT